MDVSRPELLKLLSEIVEEAGRNALAARTRGLEIHTKADGSPVTSADLGAEAFIRKRLCELAPGVTIISEESWPADEVFLDPTRYFLIDPIDGTLEYIAGRHEFTVNLALVEYGLPTLGIIYAPATDRLFLASSGKASQRGEDGIVHLLRCSNGPVRRPPIILVSRTHSNATTEAAISSLPGCIKRPLGSSLKFALIAAGEADLYARFAPTMAWDTAAGQAVVEAAGGAVITQEGTRLRYGGPGGLKNRGFVAGCNQYLAQAFASSASRTLALFRGSMN